jgi:hypothetical protein
LQPEIANDVGTNTKHEHERDNLEKL